MPAQRYVTLTEICREYGFDRKYLLAQSREGNLPMKRAGRSALIDREQFAVWLRIWWSVNGEKSS